MKEELIHHICQQDKFKYWQNIVLTKVQYGSLHLIKGRRQQFRLLIIIKSSNSTTWIQHFLIKLLLVNQEQAHLCK